MSSNPMMRHKEDQAHRDMMAEKHADELAAMAAAASKMQNALIKAKQSARGKTRPLKRNSRSRGQITKKRTQFNQKKTDIGMTDEELDIQMSEVNLSVSSDNVAGSTMNQKKKKKKKKKGRGGGDGGSGTAFNDDDMSLGFDIYDTSQDATIEPLPMYTNPSNLEAEAARFPSPRVHSRTRSTFRKHQSGEGYTYYEDTESGETVWDLPEGGEVLEF